MRGNDKTWNRQTNNIKKKRSTDIYSFHWISILNYEELSNIIMFIIFIASQVNQGSEKAIFQSSKKMGTWVSLK